MGNTGTLGDDGTSCEYLFDQAAETNYMAEDDLFAIFESLDSVILLDDNHHRPCKEAAGLVSQKSSTSSILLPSQDSDDHQLVETTSSPKSKRQKTAAAAVNSSDNEAANDGQQRMSHISVERNRRKQMNEHLSVLRSLMPCFYVKRGDQASIIGGVVDYVNELQQVLQSLEAKKQRKVYSEVLSPRLAGVSSSSPRPSPILSPRKPPLSPRLNLPVSPRTPQPGSSYKPAARLQQHQQAAAAASAGGYLSPTSKPNTANNNSSAEPSPCSSSSASSVDTVNELVANSKSAAADVEVKFSGANLVLKTVSPRIPGQALKIISVLEDLAFEILHVSISTVDETMHNFFTIKIGIECQLSAEELAQQIHQTFC